MMLNVEGKMSRFYDDVLFCSSSDINAIASSTSVSVRLLLSLLNTLQHHTHNTA